MKKNLYSLLTASVLLLGVSATAQEVVPETPAMDAKKNVVKINLSSLIFKNISLQYERVIAPKTSVALGVSLMPKTGLPFAGALRDQFGDNTDAARAIDETRLSNFSVTPEVRFYLGKKQAPAGFYLAPFLRYNRLTFDQMYTFTPNDNQLHTANIKGRINNVGGGLLLGAQWHLSNALTLDWWIAGPTIGKASGKFTGTDPKGIPQADREDIKNDIESTDFPGYDVKATVGANQIDVDLKGTYYGLRAFGIALGFKF